jgi:excisionase family DNA binding protein
MTIKKSSLEQEQKLSEKEILSLSEAAKFLNVSKSCIYKITSQKQIPHYVPGGKKIYFRKEDLENWILKSKVDSVIETESITENFLFNSLKIKNHD